MYKKYRINLSESELMISSRRDYYKRKGDEILATMKPESPTNVVSRLFDGNSILDASLLTGAWFPPVEADVFISHSHRDVYKLFALLVGYTNILAFGHLLMLVYGSILTIFSGKWITGITCLIAATIRIKGGMFQQHTPMLC
ncbi:hypothetical protein OVA10_22685 [Lelliottia sp. SL45]|uniref:hypothetical protein n=1 Tax=Lelliottia sp. SL45 TaxID=2994665 RepID=UPI00227485F7|nr:hypothetical protein [Lelliottia sp. SL45]MCY1700839.1 hypothetical protein [Lelliottia sp. SL45]